MTTPESIYDDVEELYTNSDQADESKALWEAVLMLAKKLEALQAREQKGSDED